MTVTPGWVPMDNLKGPQGDKGAPGDQGPPGEPGPRGFQGPVGPQGPQGLTGPRGLQGDKGDGGQVGPQGPQGVKGDKGDTGNTGATGAKGDTGDTTPASTASATGTVDLTTQAPETRRRVLSGNVTVSAPTAGANGLAYTSTVVFAQAATGGPYTVTWPASLEWAGDAPGPTMPSAANAELVVHLLWTGFAWRAFHAGTFFP